MSWFSSSLIRILFFKRKWREGESFIRCCGDSFAVSFKICLEIFKEGHSSIESGFILLVGRNHPGNQSFDSWRLLSAELFIHQIDVMNDFSDRAKGRFFESRSFNQNFEGAAVSLMGKLRIEHIEPKFSRLRMISLAEDEFEFCLWIDKAADQPGAGDPIDMDPFSSHPGTALKRIKGKKREGGGAGRSASYLNQMRLQSRDRPLGRLPFRRMKEIDPYHFGELTMKSAEMAVGLSKSVDRELSSQGFAFQVCLRFFGQLVVIGLSRRPEERFDL